jgi:hypothetical protein
MGGRSPRGPRINHLQLISLCLGSELRPQIGGLLTVHREGVRLQGAQGRGVVNRNYCGADTLGAYDDDRQKYKNASCRFYMPEFCAA